jgi:hypothetical protein
MSNGVVSRDAVTKKLDRYNLIHIKICINFRVWPRVMSQFITLIFTY